MSQSALEPRTLAPPERRVVEVVASEPVGAYSLITALDDSGPAQPRPGQFYMLAAAERWGGGADERPYLPRAFSYARAHAGEGGTRLQFLLENVGPGTERLGELRPGEGLGMLGPLGLGFRADPPPDRPLLVGGGIGTAPLLCLADALGGRAEVMLGFRTAGHAEAASLFDGDVAVATDDGSVGRSGLVTDLLREALSGSREGVVVHACGPPPMLEAVRVLCREQDVPAQLALESGMACGFGACFGCVVPTTDGYARVCVDGPVFDAKALTPDD